MLKNKQYKFIISFRELKISHIFLWSDFKLWLPRIENDGEVQHADAANAKVSMTCFQSHHDGPVFLG